MLNPDGVYHGHTRTDTRGADLNRAFAHPSHGDHPSVYACMEVIKQLHATGELCAYIDCHAHAGRRGCFFYGNAMAEDDEDGKKQRLESALFAKLVSMNTPSFDFDGCTWFGADDHKKGSARAAVFGLTACPHVYTLECNYDSGVSTNTLALRHGASDLPRGRLSPEPLLASSRNISPKYTPYAWRSIGKAIAIAVLDMANANPHSRVGPMGGGGDRGDRLSDIFARAQGIGSLQKLRAAVASSRSTLKKQSTAAARSGGGSRAEREMGNDDEEDDSGEEG